MITTPDERKIKWQCRIQDENLPIIKLSSLAQPWSLLKLLDFVLDLIFWSLFLVVTTIEHFQVDCKRNWNLANSLFCFLDEFKFKWNSSLFRLHQ